MHNERSIPVPLSHAAAARFTAWSALGLAGVVVLGTAIGTVLTVAGFPGLFSAHGGENASDATAGPWSWLRYGLVFVGEIGSQMAWVVLPAAVVWLLVRECRHLAAFVAVTGAGAMVLAPAVQQLVRFIPSTIGVSTTTQTMTFPSALALGTAVAGGAMLLVFLPAIPVRWRLRAAVMTAITVLGVAVAEIALDSLSTLSVIGGLVLGLLWFGMTAWLFRRWRADEGLHRRSLREGLMPEDRMALVPAPIHGSPMSGASHGWVKLTAAAAVLAVVLIGAGLLVTETLGAVRRFDTAVIDWFAAIRSDSLSLIASIFGALGNTSGVVAVLLFAIPLTFAITRRRAPAAFLAVAAIGETTLYLTASSFVGRARPAVEHLVELPPTSSFPSGHVAASLVTYGGIALLLVAWMRSRLRYAAIVLAALITVGVALSRLYRGVHYPTDTLFSVLYAAVWLALCWYLFRPGRGAPSREKDPDNA